MVLLLILLLVLLPEFAGNYWLSVATLVGYTVLSAMGVQLLIGYCGQVTLGHSAFIAVGAYTSAILMLQYEVPYLLSLAAAGLVAGGWSVLFGLASAKVKGFYLIMTSMAAQFITVDFVITQFVSQIGGRGVALSIPPGTIKVGPWLIDNDLKVYYLMIFLVVLCTLGLSNLMRTKIGRAWIAIRDNDIAAETMGVNIVGYKLMAFFVAGVLGGIAGAFWVSSLAALSPSILPGAGPCGSWGHPDRRSREHPRHDLRRPFHDPDPGRPEVRRHSPERGLSPAPGKNSFSSKNPPSGCPSASFSCLSPRGSLTAGGRSRIISICGHFVLSPRNTRRKG